MYYAQLANGTVVAETETHSALPESLDLILRESNIPSVLGCSYDGEAFHAPEPVPVPRHISVGAFYDRFGAAKWGILADVSPGVVAVIRDASVRSYIDLDNPQLPGGLQIIEAAGHTIDKSAILSAPVLDSEKP